jgi:hypothetical protein
LHWPFIQRRHIQNSQKGCSQASWEARPYHRKILFEPVLHPLAILGRAAVLPEDVMGISSYLIASFDTVFSYLLCSSFSIVSRALFYVSIAHNLYAVRPARSSQIITALNCNFLLIYLWWNVSFCFYLCFDRQLRRFRGGRQERRTT